MFRFTLMISFCLCSLAANAGLDIIAYEKLSIVSAPKFDKDGRPLGEQQVKLAPVEFAERFTGLIAGKVYKYQSAFSFRAGSYSGYNDWRNELAKLAGYAQTPYQSLNGEIAQRYDVTVWNVKKGPFWELIDFSDSEGVIGPVVCKRISKDFIQYQSAASKHPDKSFRNAYEGWKKAFSMCANSGAIAFY
ncbi:hypothetical protein [Iodobacter fluviatilis]|uniref:Uncharacterized protein n=1 Tax=Iodobacter fluviatilis TaxID=537 RepID=A0A377SUR9_9NEIS|nr:hypothetical protein [Iodobacter fluviatilis]TCU82968.1 hypothetical protein EV682_11328 [Iodobacter fluviatilis]STR45791.1 Uncharacterised protein [Iodobacter fluviatilis]